MNTYTRTRWSMHPLAMVVWSFFVAAVFGAEWTDPAMGNTSLWVSLAAYFAVFEAIGGVRRHRGDMLSEYLWTFSSGKWGAQAFTASFGVYFAARLYMLLIPADWPSLPGWLPRAVLITGFAVWIAVHMATEGRKG